MRRNWLFVAALGVPAFLLPSQAWGQVVQTGKDAELSTATKGRLGGSATLGTDMGLGTFVTDDYSDNPYFAQSLRLVPTYGLSASLLALVDAKLTWEYTAPDSPTNTVGRHVTPSDIRLGLTHTSLYRDNQLTGINVSGSLRYSLPTSPVSRGRGRVGILTGTAGLDRTFIERLTLAYALGITKYINTSKTPKDPPEGSRTHCFENPSDCPGEGINQNMAFANTLSASYRFTDRLSASMALGFTTFLKYKVGDSSEPEHNGGFDNRHTQTWTTGDVSASYRIARHKDVTYSVAGGITSEQLMADSRGTARFPFFDFETASDNYTLFYVNGTASY